MRPAFVLIVNFFCRGWPTPATRVFWNENARCTNPPRSPCVFSGKMRLAFNVTAPGVRIFFKENACRAHPSRLLVFSQVKRVLRLGFTSQCELSHDAASPCRMSFLFPRENAPRRNCQEVSKLEKSPICWPRSIVSKGDVGSCDSHLTKRVSLFQVKSRCSYAVHNSSQNPCDTVGCQKVTYHRMPVENLEVVKCCKHWKTIGPSQTRRTHALNMQRMEAKARIFSAYGEKIVNITGG